MNYTLVLPKTMAGVVVGRTGAERCTAFWAKYGGDTFLGDKLRAIRTTRVVLAVAA